MRYVKFGIIGTGPSGLYLGKYLSKNIKNCKIDFFEKSNQLLGLFKNGVAPDKINIKNNSYHLLINHNYRFFTNIHIGKDLELEKLLEYYNAIFICCGCEDCNEYKILNEQIGVFNSLNLIHFYNHFPINNILYHNLPIYHIKENSIKFPPNHTNTTVTVTSTPETNTNTNTTLVPGTKDTTTYNTHTTHTTTNNKDTTNTLTSTHTNNTNTNTTNTNTKDTRVSEDSKVSEDSGVGCGGPNTVTECTVGIEEYMEYLIGLKKVNISIIGNGNVSLDIVRMLTKSEEELENLEINPKFKYYIKNLNINKITIFGRNSLINSKFTNNELQLIFNSNFHIQHNFNPFNSNFNLSNLNLSNLNLENINLSNINLENINLSNINLENRKIIKKLKLFNSIKINENLDKHKCIIDFKFNTKIVKIINNNNIINSILYTNTSTQENNSTPIATVENIAAENIAAVENNSVVNSLDSNILIKCIGYNNKSNRELIKLIDNKRVFGNGWIINNCKGDLSNIILNSIQLSNQIKYLFKQFHYFNNDILNFFKSHHYI